jgi:hypothetical protein
MKENFSAASQRSELFVDGASILSKAHCLLSQLS